MERVIKNSLEIKASFITEDEFDKSRRRLLNYGHCFGHAIETATNFIIPHGQAVILGMYLANSVSVKRGILSLKKHREICENIFAPILLYHLEMHQFDKALILDAMRKDKKRIDDRLIVILLSEALELKEYNDLSLKEIEFAFLSLLDWLAKRQIDV